MVNKKEVKKTNWKKEYEELQETYKQLEDLYWATEEALEEESETLELLKNKYDEIDEGYKLKIPETFEELYNTPIELIIYNYFNSSKVLKKGETIIHKHPYVKLLHWKDFFLSPFNKYIKVTKDNFDKYAKRIRIKKQVK